MSVCLASTANYKKIHLLFKKLCISSFIFKIQNLVMRVPGAGRCLRVVSPFIVLAHNCNQERCCHTDDVSFITCDDKYNT